MAYDSTQQCNTAGCEGRPFFGETAHPGYCDDCHVRLCEVEAAREQLRKVLDRLDTENDDQVRADLLDSMYDLDERFPELHSEVVAYR